MADPLREQRAMILCALPYPPLPVQVGKVESNSMILSGEVAVTTTHALISQCMNACVLKNDSVFNKKRQERQRQVLQEFLYKLAQIGFLLEGVRLYDLYCEFSYKHIKTFFEEHEHPSVQFLPYDSVCIGDAVHQKMVEYCKAQCILFKETPEDYEHMNLDSLLKACRKKLGTAEDDSEELRPLAMNSKKKTGCRPDPVDE
jgi:hypothetical protein